MIETSRQTIRVMIVDNHTVVRTGLRMLIETRADMHVVAEAARRADALAAIAREHPDIIVLDLDLGAEQGIELLPDLVKHAGEARIIVLTGLHEPELHRRAIQLGAVGLVFKDQAADILLKAIERVQAGEVWIDRTMMASVLSEITQIARGKEPNPEEIKIASLTDREREVVALICEGLQNKAIAQQLSISDTTVRHHLTSIYDKLGVTNRLGLVIYAYRNGLVQLPR